MPRINATEEEIALLERVRRKNTETLGFNAGLEQAALLASAFIGGSGELPSNKWTEDYTAHLRSLKRDLSL